LVAAPDLGSGSERSVGSSPFIRTNPVNRLINRIFFAIKNGLIRRRDARQCVSYICILRKRRTAVRLRNTRFYQMKEKPFTGLVRPKAKSLFYSHDFENSLSLNNSIIPDICFNRSNSSASIPIFFIIQASLMPHSCFRTETI
jgi:hypothetical protein